VIGNMNFDFHLLSLYQVKVDSLYQNKTNKATTLDRNSA
jgi:hypothetical protein